MAQITQLKRYIFGEMLHFHPRGLNHSRIQRNFIRPEPACTAEVVTRKKLVTQRIGLVIRQRSIAGMQIHGQGQQPDELAIRQDEQRCKVMTTHTPKRRKFRLDFRSSG